MGFREIVRSGVEIANSLTEDLQSEVTFERYTGMDVYGTIQYAAPITLKALVDWNQRSVRTSTGQLTVTRATITFLDVTALVTATAGNGIDDKDRIVLPDGSTGPILDVGGFLDAETGQPFATEVYLG